MTEPTSSSDVLDEQRPWITDPRALPSNINWLYLFTSPSGASPPLHFTRGWTFLFFAQLLIIVVPLVVSMIVGIAGADGDAVMVVAMVTIALAFCLTTLGSFVLHLRRLNDAGRNQAFAFLVLIPLFVALGVFYAGIGDKSESYDALYAERAAYLADPQAWRDKKLLEKQQEQAAERSQADPQGGASSGPAPPPGVQGAGPGGRSGPGGWGRGLSVPDEPEAAELPLPSQFDYIVRPNLVTIPRIMVPLSAFVALWSLLWLARQPTAKELS
ncbi:MAG: DUF805 domain-containing protein [Pseudomonadota bacterium]